MNMVQAKLTRWTEILSSLDSFGFLSTSQIQRLHNLGGRRNTTRILTDMGELLSSFREGETVYYLSAKGRREIGSQKARRRTQLVQHTLMRNEVYIAQRPEIWKPEYSVKWEGKEIIADAIYRKGGVYTFVEIDLTQSMAANERKVLAYKELRNSGKWQAKYGTFPNVLFVTTTEQRKAKLIAASSDLSIEVITFNDLK
ncbi:replication-relaxation family protein [Paenibacillus chibensis]|uniref:Replication-relaxation family protein n=1 Tax=Paenibacillus chibensis TaxID=59846 RepID=A0ABU6PP79_9BACL|nr:replication-relaxation family protein [Paenibacillus chibensis]